MGQSVPKSVWKRSLDSGQLKIPKDATGKKSLNYRKASWTTECTIAHRSTVVALQSKFISHMKRAAMETGERFGTADSAVELQRELRDVSSELSAEKSALLPLTDHLSFRYAPDRLSAQHADDMMEELTDEIEALDVAAVGLEAAEEEEEGEEEEGELEAD